MISNKDSFVFTSESVSEGHPDKVCDQISDVILDLYMKADKNSRVACETLATTNRVILSGEVNLKTNNHLVNKEIIDKAIREKIRQIGYEQDGFHWKNLIIDNYLHQQSPDISQGVDKAADADDTDQGAGDQGLMFGYACTETPNFMPAPIHYSHKILKELSRYRHQNDSFFGPDSKSQVSMSYENDEPKNITSVVVSTQHLESASNKEIRKKVLEIVEQALPIKILPSEKEILINPTGRFVVGGPDGDTGLTGRKIIVDTYGGSAPHGGGAFSGKDYTKVDRSAAYMARFLAKNVVASKIAKKCLIQISYAIGVAKPVSIYLKTDHQSNVNTKKLIEIINSNVDLSPSGIKKFLQLDRPIYEETATYGHFGKEPCNKTGSFSWERLDLVDCIIKNY
tara:strand:+ start:68 stop:1258 length:1191 start_codon:yes stop_codon:yes gene_type:complete